MDKENPKVSVIICAYTMERLRDIHEAVDSVLAQTFKPYEVIVAVDHNKELFQRLKDSLPEQVKFVLNEGANGLSETRNVGIRASTGEITAFIDDDAVAEGDWLENLAKQFHDPKVVAVGGRAIPIWPSGRRPLWFAEELDWIVGCTYKGLPLNGNEIRNVPGCNMAFSKQAFEVAGLFGKNFGRVGDSGVGEEADFCLRLKYKLPDALILYEPRAVIYHKVPPWRLALKYMVKRSFDEGVYKSKLKNLSLSVPQNQLSTESSYLRYLLFTAIPERLRCFWKEGSLLQVGAIVIGIAAVGMGYLMGSLLIKEDIRGIY
ncbi:glycosyltransferase [Dehalococcoidia bacterium]|nr:glycosyltransferase [Dehalococcoidia bacterium]